MGLVQTKPYGLFALSLIEFLSDFTNLIQSRPPPLSNQYFI